MKKAKKATAKENSFFEDDVSYNTKDIIKEQKQTKEVIVKESSYGEFYNKNAVYKYRTVKLAEYAITKTTLII